MPEAPIRLGFHVASRFADSALRLRPAEMGGFHALLPLCRSAHLLAYCRRRVLHRTGCQHWQRFFLREWDRLPIRCRNRLHRGRRRALGYQPQVCRCESACLQCGPAIGNSEARGSHCGGRGCGPVADHDFRSRTGQANAASLQLGAFGGQPSHGRAGGRVGVKRHDESPVPRNDARDGSQGEWIGISMLPGNKNLLYTDTPGALPSRGAIPSPADCDTVCRLRNREAASPDVLAQLQRQNSPDYVEQSAFLANTITPQSDADGVLYFPMPKLARDVPLAKNGKKAGLVRVTVPVGEEKFRFILVVE